MRNFLPLLFAGICVSSFWNALNTFKIDICMSYTDDGSVVDGRSKLPPCTFKYILVTTQRSGSTWLCHQLDQWHQAHWDIKKAIKPSTSTEKIISCGWFQNRWRPEVMINYSFLTTSEKEKVLWEDYSRDIDQAFDRVCSTNPGIAVGFKLMYDQIPGQFVNDSTSYNNSSSLKLSSSLLETYFQKRNISIVHLVREATILKMASGHNAVVQRQSGKVKEVHSINASEIKDFRDVPRMPWDNGTIDQMVAIEKQTNDFNSFFHSMPNVPDFYLSYESLLLLRSGQNFERRLQQVVSFAHRYTDFDTPATKEEDDHHHVKEQKLSLLQLHEPRCIHRINNYSHFRMHTLVRNSRSAKACDLIDKIYDDME